MCLFITFPPLPSCLFKQRGARRSFPGGSRCCFAKLMLSASTAESPRLHRPWSRLAPSFECGTQRAVGGCRCGAPVGLSRLILCTRPRCQLTKPGQTWTNLDMIAQSQGENMVGGASLCWSTRNTAASRAHGSSTTSGNKLEIQACNKYPKTAAKSVKEVFKVTGLSFRLLQSLQTPAELPD